MKINVYVDNEYKVFTQEEVHEHFMHDVYEEDKAELLYEFLNDCISSTARDTLFDVIANCDSTYLNDVSKEFEEFINNYEETWLQDEYYISTINV